MPPSLAYHSDPALKVTTVAQMEAHRRADDFIQGTYWESGTGKGCAVGCLTKDPSGGHETYPARWGIPEELARLEDAIFEGLAEEQAKAWPVRFLAAVPVGADLSRVADRLKLWILRPDGAGLLDRSDPDAEQAIDRVARLIDRRLLGDEPSAEEWSAAESAARSAAQSAAWSAAQSAAWSAARSVQSAARSAAQSAQSAAWSAESAAWSAQSAAWSAAQSAAWSAQSAARSAARSAAWSKIADQLISLLETA